MRRLLFSLTLAACLALSCDRAPLAPHTPAPKAAQDSVACAPDTVYIWFWAPLGATLFTADPDTTTNPHDAGTDPACPDYCDDTSGCAAQGLSWRCGRRGDGTCGSICESL